MRRWEMKVLDLRGAVCPIPVVRTKKALEEMGAGEVLEVVLDYPPSKENVRRFVESQGHEVLSVEEEGGTVRMRIRKKSEEV